MKFWKFSSQALALLLASVTVVSASGPTDGEAAADPNSAVVKLTADAYKSFIEENPLVLAEFFAPWCGYCKQLGPEYSKAADSLNESHPDIKLAQIDCTEEEQLCADHGIRGYPTLKVIRGENVEDYDGPRNADGISDYMIKQSLPSVTAVVEADEVATALSNQQNPFIVQVIPPGAVDEAANATFYEIADAKRKDLAFLSVSSDEAVAALDKKINVSLSKLKEPKYLVFHPSDIKEPSVFEGEVTKEALSEFAANEIIPFFGDINRDTFMRYMESPLPLAYYFYNSPEERAKVESFFNKLGKEYRGKINFVGLNAALFARHAEALSMDPSIVPLFAITDTPNNKKYGIDQQAHPNGPSEKDITAFVKDFLAGKAEPIIKSEPLPTEEDISKAFVRKLVTHNHDEIVNDLSKDVFVKYYAPWCGHCKKLAPIWEDLAEIYQSNSTDAQVIIAGVDHTANDVTTEKNIEGYPTLIFYPANGKIDPETGFRESITFSGTRDLDSFVEFIKEKGGLQIDGKALKEAREAEANAIVEDDEEEEKDEAEAEDFDHDEL